MDRILGRIGLAALLLALMGFSAVAVVHNGKNGPEIASPVISGSPAARPSSDPSTPAPSANASTADEPTTPAPTATVPTPTTAAPNGEPAKVPAVPSFAQPYRYDDGVVVEVTHIKRSKLGSGATAHHVKRGSAIQILSVRVTNGTGRDLGLSVATQVMRYGPHQQVAATVLVPQASRQLEKAKPLTGTLAPGASRTGTLAFAVPKKHLTDATLQLAVEANRAPAVFRGSLGYSPKNSTLFNNPMGSKAETLTITSHIERSIDAAQKGSTIRIAHYAFDIKKSSAKILAAHRRGVHVQMIVDQHNDVVTDETEAMMEELGTNRKKKSFIVRCRASCMSNHASAMHAKFYLFSAVGNSPMVSMVSSANITHTNSKGSWNDLQTIVGDATIYNSLKQYFDDMVPDKNRPHYYRTTTSGPYKLYFFPRASQKNVPMLAALKEVSCSGAAAGYGDKDGHTIVRVMMYSWRGSRIDIAKQLQKLLNQGCKIQIVLNSGRTDLAIKRALTRQSEKYGEMDIYDAWVDRNGNNVAERYMHEKGLTINGVLSGRPATKVVYSGSQNFAPASTTDNNELILRHFSDETYDLYAKNFAYITKHGTRPLW